MSSSTIIAVYIAIAAADLGWGILLGLLNHRSVLASEARVPQELSSARDIPAGALRSFVVALPLNLLVVSPLVRFLFVSLFGKK